MTHLLNPMTWLRALAAGIGRAVRLADRARRAIGRTGSEVVSHRAPDVLPSLYDVHPAASTAPRRPVGVRTVPLDRILGTLRHPSQNTSDFLPLRHLRGGNWRSRWQRITAAVDRLDMLPPIDLVQVGDDYWLEDGHNRVAAALRAGAESIDADVTQLLLPDLRPTERGWVDASSVVGGEQLRQAATGRLSRTVEQRTTSDSTSRTDLLRGAPFGTSGSDDETGEDPGA